MQAAQRTSLARTHHLRRTRRAGATFCPSVLLSFCPSVLLSFCPLGGATRVHNTSNRLPATKVHSSVCRLAEQKKRIIR
ncbi:hypothetical protein CFR75_12235 [Komagataeibacter xylinus]|uniref:Uncharacterized protein n=1 Tax=Komagataeibacter xylinus TaxID=28448 RepID=A0A318PG46_KOMXY|nr:hypothetical protein CFR75_12235 [Komagataeibacter xylinus]